MNRIMLATGLALATLALAAPPAAAQGKAKAAQELAEFVLQRFGKEAAKDGAQALARRIETAAAAHGDEVLKAVRLVGPRGLHLIEEAGVHSKQVAKVLATHGESGVVFVTSRPKAMQLLLQHGEEEVAAALVKSRGVALPAIEAFGKPAARAFQSLGTPQNARRLAMMAAEGGELAQIGRTPEMLAVLERWGDPALEFLWRHRAILASASVLGVFLADPQPFITGAKDITQVLAEQALNPLASVPAIVAKEGTQEVVRRTNWTVLFLAVLAVLTLLVLSRKRRSRPAAVTSSLQPQQDVAGPKEHTP